MRKFAHMRILYLYKIASRFSHVYMEGLDDEHTADQREDKRKDEKDRFTTQECAI